MPSSEQPDSDRVAWVEPSEFPRITASLDEPTEPNPRIKAAVEQMRAERTPTPDRDGYTIGVYLPPGVTGAVRDALFDRIADAAHTADWHQPWDAHVVGVAGDPLGAVDGEARP